MRLNPPIGKSFPEKMKLEWERIYDGVYEKYGNKQRAARITWYQIEKKWKKDPKTGQWVLRKKRTPKGGFVGKVQRGAKKYYGKGKKLAKKGKRKIIKGYDKVGDYLFGKKKNPLMPADSVIEFFEIQLPRNMPYNPIEAYDLGTILGVLRGLELWNETFYDDINSFILNRFGKSIEELKPEQIFGPNELKNPQKAFEVGVISGLASAGKHYCHLSKNELKDFVQIARFKLNSLSHYL